MCGISITARDGRFETYYLARNGKNKKQNKTANSNIKLGSTVGGKNISQRLFQFTLSSQGKMNDHCGKFPPLHTQCGRDSMNHGSNDSVTPQIVRTK